MRLTKEFLLRKYRIHESFLSGVAGYGLAAAATAMPMNRQQPVQQQTTQQAKDTAPKYADEDIKKMIKGDEGVRTKMYTDTKGINTVGVGHNLANEKASSAAFAKAFGDQGAAIRKSVMTGQSMTEDQVNKLLQVDYEEHRARTAKMIPNLHEYPPEVQSVLVSGTFRGHVTDSPNFRKQLAAGKYEEAANELLNRDEYTNPKKDKNGNLVAPGVKTRLERDANTIRSLAKKNAEQKTETEKSVTTPGNVTTTPPVTPPASSQQNTANRDHIVGKGDTLSGIATKYGTTIEQIMKANPNIKNPNRISEKQKIKIN